MTRSFEHVKYLRQDEIADRLGPVERLVYRSNKLGANTDEQWRRTFDVNVLGSHIVADEAGKILRTQGLPHRAVGMANAELCQVVVRRRAGHLAKDPRERADRVPGAVGDLLDVHVCRAVVAEVREHVAEPAPRRDLVAVDRGPVAPQRDGELDEQALCHDVARVVETRS
jgi:hypothetical protein